MALIALAEDVPEALVQRLRALLEPEHRLVAATAPEVRLIIHSQARWRSSWTPANRQDAARRALPVLLLCPREPAHPLHTWFAGIDALLPPDANDEALLTTIAGLLARG